MRRMLPILAFVGFAMALWLALRADDALSLAHTVWAVTALKVATPILLLFAGDAVVGNVVGKAGHVVERAGKVAGNVVGDVVGNVAEKVTVSQIAAKSA